MTGMAGLLDIAVLVFDDVEVLDFAGPFEVFSTAARLARPQAGAVPMPGPVRTIATRPGVVVARGGLRVTPDEVIGGGARPDVLMVPGGVVDAELGRRELIDWLRRQADAGALVGAVCTGAFLLAEAGLLDGRRATTHWEDAGQLRARYPRIEVCEGVRYVDAGRVLTSAGIAAGIDLSLHLVRRLFGGELATRTARQMDYPWTAGTDEVRP